MQLIEVDEVLSMDGIDFGRAAGMPLVDAHNTFSIDSKLGASDGLQVEDVEGLGRSLTGTARFVPSRAPLAEAIPPDDEFDETAGDLVYNAAGKGVTQPVNRVALRNEGPRIFEWSNQAAGQLAAMYVADGPELIWPVGLGSSSLATTRFERRTSCHGG